MRAYLGVKQSIISCQTVNSRGSTAQRRFRLGYDPWEKSSGKENLLSKDARDHIGFVKLEELDRRAILLAGSINDNLSADVLTLFQALSMFA